MQVSIRQPWQDDAPFHVLLLGIWILGQQVICLSHREDPFTVDDDRRLGGVGGVLSVDVRVIEKFHSFLENHPGLGCKEDLSGWKIMSISPAGNLILHPSNNRS